MLGFIYIYIHRRCEGEGEIGVRVETSSIPEDFGGQRAGESSEGVKTKLNTPWVY